MIIVNVTLIVINLIVYITVPRLNEKDAETLNTVRPLYSHAIGSTKISDYIEV